MRYDWLIFINNIFCKWGVGVIFFLMMYEVIYLCVGYDFLMDNDIGLFYDI